MQTNPLPQHKPPEGFIQFEIVWADHFPRDQETSIETRMQDALADGTLHGCALCRTMKARVYRMEHVDARFASFLKCTCGQTPHQMLDGELV